MLILNIVFFIVTLWTNLHGAYPSCTDHDFTYASLWPFVRNAPTNNTDQTFTQLTQRSPHFLPEQTSTPLIPCLRNKMGLLPIASTPNTQQPEQPLFNRSRSPMASQESALVRTKTHRGSMLQAASFSPSPAPVPTTAQPLTLPNNLAIIATISQASQPTGIVRPTTPEQLSRLEIQQNFIAAIKTNNADEYTRWKAKGAGVNVIMEEMTPLRTAIVNGHPDIVRRLLLDGVIVTPELTELPNQYCILVATQWSTRLTPDQNKEWIEKTVQRYEEINRILNA